MARSTQRDCGLSHHTPLHRARLQRLPFGFAQGRLYEDGTNWLVRETWHSAISGNTFDLVRYWYTNGRPSRAEIATLSWDWSTVLGYTTRYFQYNWHGDANTFVELTGGAASGMTYDPWGAPIQYDPSPLNYYRWNGAWGYLTFDGLGLYYVHGRWYNPDTGMWLSPDEKGEYLYGSGQNPVTKGWIRDDFDAWALLAKTSPLPPMTNVQTKLIAAMAAVGESGVYCVSVNLKCPIYRR